jgi:hypothetical protein
MRAFIIIALVWGIVLLAFRDRIGPWLRHTVVWLSAKNRRVVIFIALVDVLFSAGAATTLACITLGEGPVDTIFRLVYELSLKPVAVVVSLLILGIVGWRGASDARRIISGEPKWLRLAVEGFFGGFLLPLFEFLILLSPLAYAGIPLYMEAKTWGIYEWLFSLLRVFLESGKVGVVGAVLGCLIGTMNRLIVKRLVDCRTNG